MAAKLNPYINKKPLCHVNIKNLCSLKAIQTIKEKLNPSQLARFEASCFGKAFLISTEMKFSGQLIHHLLLSQAEHPNDDEMWFVIGNKPVRFSLYEFALITGLNCGDCSEGVTSRSTRLQNTYFRGQKTISLELLKLNFLSCVDEEDTFRFSLVYFLMSVLLSRDYRSKIDERWLSLVNDLESFDKFPWGKLCYEITLGYLKRPVKAMLTQDLNGHKFDSTPRKEIHLKLGGFPYAFQVWAYEAIPTLASKFAVKKANLVPRILCWETPLYLGSKELRKTIFSSKNLDVLKTLRATEHESKQDYMKSIAMFNNTLEDVHTEDGDTMLPCGIMNSADSAETSMAANLNRCITKTLCPTLVVNLSSLNAIQVIKGKLNPSQYERFEASCFGKLFRLPSNIKLSKKILRQLFSSQVDHLVENEIWFAIGGKLARFSQCEFALITGLNCRQYPTRIELESQTQSTRLKDKYFNGRDMVTTRSLEQQFLSCVDEDDTLKLAMTYFLETILIGRRWKNSIDQRWLSLVDDLEAFNNFAWGKLSYEKTLCSFKISAKGRFGHDMRKKHQKCYSLYGFPYAFQVWAYEAIPFVASKYAEKKANLIPRILCWECKESANCKEIDENVFRMENVEVLKKLGASEFESKQDYMKSIVEFTRMLEEKDDNADGAMQHYEIDDYDLPSVATRLIFCDPVVGKKKGKALRAEKNDDVKGSGVMAAISWARGNGKRTTKKRRKMESYVPFPRSSRLRRQSLASRETVSLDRICKLGTKDVNNVLESLSWSTGNRKRTSRKRRKVDSSRETEQEPQQSLSVTENLSHVLAHQNEAFVSDQSLNRYPLSVDLLEQLDAVLQHELELDFPGEEPSQTEAVPPATSTNGSRVEIEVIELSDEVDYKTGC